MNRRTLTALLVFIIVMEVMLPVAPFVSASSINLDNWASNTGSSSSGSVYISHSANAMLILEVGVDNNGCPGAYVTSLSVSGSSANFWGRQTDGICQTELEVWYLYRPSSGTDSVYFTIANLCCQLWAVLVMSFTGVASPNPFEHPPSTQTFQYGASSYQPQIYVPDTLTGRRVIFFTDIPQDHCSCSWFGYGYGQTQIDGQPLAPPNGGSWLGASYEDSDRPLTMFESVNGPTPWAGFADALVPTAPATVSITVTSSPTGSGYVTVDGSQVTTPYTQSWTVGSTHTFAAQSPVTCGSGCQYVWQSWTDNDAESHMITVPSSSATYTAIFQQQYSLTVSAASGGATVPSGTSWQNMGQQVSVSATPSSGYTFTGWILDGQNVGSQKPVSVTMDQAHSLTANFAPIGTLCPYVNTDPPDLAPQPSQVPSCPVEPGAQVTITAQPIPDWKFENFTVTGVAFTQNDNSVTFTMPSSAVTVIAHYSSTITPPAQGIAISAYDTPVLLLWGIAVLLMLFFTTRKRHMHCRR